MRTRHYEAARTWARGWLAKFRKTQGAQLVEFALVLPVLAVVLVGIMDFATAYNLKQKMNNAVREGARLAGSQPMSDLTQTNPPSVRVIRNEVVTYLTNANVNTSFIAASMSPQGNFTWTYYSSGTYGLKIERVVQNIPPGCGGSPANPCIVSSRITLNYPSNWTFGFNRIIRLVVPSASYAGTIAIATDAVMPNLP